MKKISTISENERHFEVWLNHESSRYSHFKKTAQTLMEKQLSQLSDKHTNMNAAPALYLYNHYFELILKDILWLSCRHAEEELPKKLLFQSHNTVKIWNKTKRYLEKFITDDNGYLNYLDDWTTLLSRIDPNELRYEFDRHGNRLYEQRHRVSYNLFKTKLYLDYLSIILEDFRNQLIEPIRAVNQVLTVDLFKDKIFNHKSYKIKIEKRI